MAKKQYRRRSPRSRSKRYLTFAVQKATAAALVLLILLPLDILLPMRIWRFANPQIWEQTQIVYEDHVRRSEKNGYFYVLHDSQGNAWRMPDPDVIDMDRFSAEVEPGDELTIRYYPWFVGNMIQSVEGYLDYENAAERSREIAKSDNAVFAFVLTVSGVLLGYIVYQLDKVHRFLPRRRK